MFSNRMKKNAVCAILILVVCGIMAGSALAGSTNAPNVNFAREVGQINRVYSLPFETLDVLRQMAVIRTSAQDFFVDVTLQNGATYATGHLPDDADLDVIGNGDATYETHIVSGGGNGANTVRFTVHVNGALGDPIETQLPVIHVHVDGWTIRDVNNVLGPGGSISISVGTADAATNTPLDVGGEADAWLFGAFGVAIGSLNSTSAVVDVGFQRKQFVATLPDDQTHDRGASLAVNNSVSGVNHWDGTPYSLTAGSIVRFTFTGPLTGVSAVSWDGWSHNLTAAEVAASSVNLDVPGNGTDTADTTFVVTVNGTTALTARVIQVQVNLLLGGNDGTTPASTANNRTLLGQSTLTTWRLNGTILLTNWTNGNSSALSGRIYLWNASNLDGPAVARIFTLPVGMGGSVLLGTVLLGSLPPVSGTNIRIAEDLLVPAGIPIPYTTNGGNLVVEITIATLQVTGYSQVFSGNFAFGTVPLQNVGTGNPFP